MRKISAALAGVLGAGFVAAGTLGGIGVTAASASTTPRMYTEASFQRPQIRPAQTWFHQNGKKFRLDVPGNQWTYWGNGTVRDPDGVFALSGTVGSTRVTQIGTPGSDNNAFRRHDRTRYVACLNFLEHSGGRSHFVYLNYTPRGWEVVSQRDWCPKP
jgi:hypothetical protein